MSKLATLLCLAFLSLAGTDGYAQPAPKPKPSRPLVFLPGIAGSELWINGRRAWGSVGAMRHLEDLRIPNGPTATEPAPTCDPANQDVRYRQSCGPINELVILGPMKYDQYEPLFKYLETLGYSRFGTDRNVFVFAYDWRRSNFDTAAQLDAFLRNTPGLAGKEIDILAHSMGGLVTLIYAHQFDAPKTADGKCDFPRSCLPSEDGDHHGHAVLGVSERRLYACRRLGLDLAQTCRRARRHLAYRSFVAVALRAASHP